MAFNGQGPGMLNIFHMGHFGTAQLKLVLSLLRSTDLCSKGIFFIWNEFSSSFIALQGHNFMVEE